MDLALELELVMAAIGWWEKREEEEMGFLLKQECAASHTLFMN